MNQAFEVAFSGGKKVDVLFGEQVVKTDQPVVQGGEGSAPNPFQLYLASIAACSGYYALEFCLSRGISTEGMRLTMEKDFDPKAKRLSRVTLALTLPPDFPDKYKTAIRRAVEACTVKKSIQAPPEFQLVIE